MLLSFRERKCGKRKGRAREREKEKEGKRGQVKGASKNLAPLMFNKTQ